MPDYGLSSVYVKIVGAFSQTAGIDKGREELDRNASLLFLPGRADYGIRKRARIWLPGPYAMGRRARIVYAGKTESRDVSMHRRIRGLRIRVLRLYRRP